MTFFFRITLEDNVAHDIFNRLKPDARVQNGAARVSNGTVRRTLAPRLRAACEVQVMEWLRALETT